MRIALVSSSRQDDSRSKVVLSMIESRFDHSKQRVALGLVVDVGGSVGDHRAEQQQLLEILKQDTYSAALQPKSE